MHGPAPLMVAKSCLRRLPCKGRKHNKPQEPAVPELRWTLLLHRLLPPVGQRVNDAPCPGQPVICDEEKKGISVGCLRGCRTSGNVREKGKGGRLPPASKPFFRKASALSVLGQKGDSPCGAETNIESRARTRPWHTR